MFCSFFFHSDLNKRDHGKQFHLTWPNQSLTEIGWVGRKFSGYEEMNFEKFYDRKNDDDNDKIIIRALRTKALDTY